MLKTGVKYLHYRQKSITKYKVHSPFVFDFIEDVLEDDGAYYNYQVVDLARKQLKKNRQQVEIIELGAGSKVSNSAQRKVNHIATHSVVGKKYGELLFRMVNYFQPTTIVELGTSLGVSAAYLAMANSKGTVYTIEGNKEVAKVAESTLQKLKVTNVKQLVGNFDEALPLLIERLPVVDLVYFDGNHRKEPTLNYFNICLNKAHENSVFIFDDIHWSDEMSETWEVIKSDPRVTLTIDLFQFGIVFFKEGMTKQDFVLKF